MIETQLKLFEAQNPEFLMRRLNAERIEVLTGSVVVPGESGSVAYPTTIAARLQSTSVQTIIHNPSFSQMRLDYTAASWDFHGNMTTGAGASKFVAPIDGIYHIDVCCGLGSHTGTGILQLYANNGASLLSELARTSGAYPAGTTYFAGSIDTALAAGTDVVPAFYNFSGGSESTTGGYASNWFNVHLVRPYTSNPNIPVPASVWPKTHATTKSNNVRPRGVVLIEVRETGSNAYIDARLDWDWVPATNTVSVRNIIGLAPGKTYNYSLLVIY